MTQLVEKRVKVNHILNKYSIVYVDDYIIHKKSQLFLNQLYICCFVFYSA